VQHPPKLESLLLDDPTVILDNPAHAHKNAAELSIIQHIRSEDLAGGCPVATTLMWPHAAKLPHFACR